MKKNFLLLLLSLFGSIFSPTLITRVEVEQHTATTSQKTVREISFVHTAQAQLAINPNIAGPQKPLYSTLGNLQAILDATGLRDNTNNSYGQCTSGIVQIWKSITPGRTDLSFNAQPSSGVAGTGSTLKLQDGHIEYAGNVVLRGFDAASNFDFLSYNATVANLKTTVHMVVCVGQEAVPNQAYGLFGTNSNSAGNRGTGSAYDDRILASNSDGLTSTLSKGSAGFIILASPDDLITPNVPFVYTEETDMSQAAGDRRKYYINGNLFAYSVTSTSTAVATPLSFQLEIGGLGNGVSTMRGWVSHVVIQSKIETSLVMQAFVQSLLPYKNKSTTYSRYFYDVDETFSYSAYNTLAGAGRYYFGQGVLQDPSNPNKLIQYFHDGSEHVDDASKHVAQRISLDKGRTWATQTTTYDYDGAGTYAMQDGEWGWESTGRIHGFSDWHEQVAGSGLDNKLFYHYSDDGGSTYTTIDKTAELITGGGYTGFRAHGNIIEPGDGYLYACLYAQTDEGVSTNTAIYLLRKPTGSSTTWTKYLVDAQPSATLYLNEQTIVALDASHILMLVRNETTNEWRQYMITLNGASAPTISDQGNIDFGETNSVGTPPMLTKFKIAGQDVICAWLIGKNSPCTIKTVYAKASSLVASGASGWDLDTKTTMYSATPILHYFNPCHVNNTFNAVAAGALEPVPFTATENSFVTFHCISNNYYVVKTELGL